MPRFIHVSDLHLGFRQYGLVQRFQDYAATFHRVIQDAVEKKAEFVLVSGDLFHFRNVDPETYMQALSVLTDAREKGVRVIAIEGNHDFALHRDRVSWLRILENQELLRLIKIKKTEGLELLGDHVDVGNTRIFGVRYIGYSTKKEIESIRSEIDFVNASQGKKDLTILMMHFGMENVLKRNISGEVSLSALQPLKDVVDYLALGHYHMQYEFDGWIFNGGSPDMVSMEEYGQPKGYYYYDGVVAKFIDTRDSVREVVRLTVNVTDSKDATDILTKVQNKLREVKEKGVRKDALVDIIIKGGVELQKVEFQVARYQELALDKLNALNVNVKLRLEGHQVDMIERDLDGLGRREIEEKVLHKLVLDHPKYKQNPEVLLSALFDIKEAVVGQKPDEYCDMMGEKLWKLYQRLEDEGEEKIEQTEQETEVDEDEKEQKPGGQLDLERWS